MTKRQSRTILFLCSGNYYRSRFAEEYFNHRAPSRDVAWRATSRGLKIGWPGNIGPVSPHCLEGLRHRGIQLTQPRCPRQVAEEDLLQAGRIIALKESEHRPHLERLFPHWTAQVEFWHIDDIDDASPAMALAALEEKLEQLLATLEQKAAA